MTGESYPKRSLKDNYSRSFFSISAIKILLTTETLSGLLKKEPKEKLTAEVCAGIEFVQICSLSSSQKKLFWRSPVSKKIITILRGKELLYGCLPYKDYCDWYSHLEKQLAGEPKTQYSNEVFPKGSFNVVDLALGKEVPKKPPH